MVACNFLQIGLMVACLQGSLLWSVHASFAQAPNDKIVTWQTIHWPPFMEISGNETKGQYSLLLDLLESGLPEYQHKRSNMPWSRVWQLIKGGEHVCNIFAFKTPERQKFAAFTVPFSIFLSNHIIVRRDALKKLNIDPTQPQSIIELTKRKGIKGFLEQSRSYSAALDKFLNPKPDGSNYFRRAIKSKGLIKVLLKGRVDYVLEYPSIVAHIRAKIPEMDGDLVSIQIKEIAPLSYGYIACPNNEWGKSVVAKLNVLIQSEKPQPRYRNIIELMASNSRELELIRQEYPKFIRNHN
jgi:uncharacterized protein (TIGR02285 family)